MKKLFINFIENRIVNPRKYNYLFYRWLVGLIIDKDETENVFFKIAHYLNNKHEPYDFTDIFILNNNVYIYTRRPGYWIGKGGKEIDDLENCINYKCDGETKLHDYHIRIIEDTESSRYLLYNLYYFLNKY